MLNIIITFDLNKYKDYQTLYEWLEEMWAERLQDLVFVLMNTKYDTSEVMDYLINLTDFDDSIVVWQIFNWWIKNTNKNNIKWYK